MQTYGDRNNAARRFCARHNFEGYAELTQFLDLSVPVVGGGALGDRVMQREAMHAQDVIRPLDRPVKAHGAMAVLYGNLCPRGAVIKHSAASRALMQHTGRAVVFDSVADLSERIDDPALDVEARRIDALVDEAELAKRAAIARPPVERPLRGYAQLYHDHVLQADAGCDFDFLTAQPARSADLEEAAE